MQKILFLVQTEYHMMVTLSLVADVFYDPDIYKIYIYQPKDASKIRFQFEKDTNIKNHVIYREFSYEKEIKKNIECILNEDWNLFILFNHHFILPVYLAKVLFKKGTEIRLAPDGLKVYNESRRITPRWSLQGALDFQRFIIKNKLSFNWYLRTMGYANLKEISKVYVHFPKYFKNHSKKEVLKLEVLESEEAKQLVNKYFKFSFFKELESTTNLIFYINQPFKNKKLFVMEKNILSELRSRFSEKELVIKLHPLTDRYQLDFYKTLQNTIIIKKSYPAELYIAELKNSIVLSFWSTACLINNKNVKIYWLYPILERKNLMPKSLKIKNHTDHIREVDNIKDIL
jgi:hypothetical protein